MSPVRRLMRLVETGILVIVWSAVLVIWSPSIQVEAGWGSNYDHVCDNSRFSQCVSPFSAWSIHHTNVPNDLKNAATYVVDLYNNHTRNDGSVVLSIAGTWDTPGAFLYMIETTIENDAVAWGKCPPTATKGNWGPHKRSCRPQYVYFNRITYPNDFNTVKKRRAIMCHEVGHVFGLRHRDNGSQCMHFKPLNLDNLANHEMNCLVANFPMNTAPVTPACVP